MNRKFKIALITLASLLAVALAAVIIVIVVKNAPPPAPTETPKPTPTAQPTATPEPTYEPTNTISSTLAVGGDVVMHSGLNAEARREDGSYDYTPIFGTLGKYISGADYAVCSLVTSLSESGPYTAYPLFRSPRSLASSIAQTGFGLVNTATANCVDGFKDGIDCTLDALDEAGLAHVGTYRNEDERARGNYTLADVGGVSVAFLSYTCETNRVPISGFEYAVSVCTEDYLSGGREVNYALIDADMAAARASGADIIFVFMSWGTEFSTQPDELQRELADYLLYQGADIIIGGHCRVPQPMELREVTDIDGDTHEAFVCYSLGNMLSCQNDPYTDISSIVHIELTRDMDTGRAWVSDVGYYPIYMADLYEYGIEDFGWHYRMVNLHAAIDAYESGQPWDFMTETIYLDMSTALTDLHHLYEAPLDVNG